MTTKTDVKMSKSCPDVMHKSCPTPPHVRLYFLRFPIHLEISIKYARKEFLALVKSLDCLVWYARNIKYLEIYCMSEDFKTDLVRICPESIFPDSLGSDLLITTYSTVSSC